MVAPSLLPVSTSNKNTCSYEALSVEKLTNNNHPGQAKASPVNPQQSRA